jgi:hypothetical protein
MPDVTGIPALDVAIGLSFVFLTLSLVASAGQEMLASLFSLRAKNLERGLRNMLTDSTPAPAGSAADAKDKADKAAEGAADQPRTDLLFAVYTHPLIRSLYRESVMPIGRTTLKPAPDLNAQAPAAGTHAAARADAVAKSVTKVRLPSYIAPRSFALALLDTIAPDVLATKPDGTPVDNHDLITQTRAAILKLHIPSGVQHRLLTLLDDARGDFDAFRHNVEAWFDDTMARVSGWYKRKSQLFILIMALVVTVAMNANTLTIGNQLWTNQALRATLVQRAATEVPAGKTPQDRLKNAVDNVAAVKEIGVPIGWAQHARADPRHVTLRHWGWAHVLGGWLLTILAVSLGAPFWFDALSRLSRLRSSGKPETPLPATGAGKPGERIVAKS